MIFKNTGKKGALMEHKSARRNFEFPVTINNSMANAQIFKEGTTLVTAILVS